MTDADLTPFDLASHWPFLERQLVLDRWRSGARALELLCTFQVAVEGEPAAFGASRLIRTGLTRGEAEMARKALVELAERGVVFRQRGKGARPDVWSLRPILRHWSMPWRLSRRDAEDVIQACISARSWHIARVNGGQSVVLGPEFHLSGGTCAGRPGLLSVDIARNVPASRANSERPGLLSVDIARKLAPAASPLLSSLNTQRQEDDGRLSKLVEAVSKATKGAPLWGNPLNRLGRLADRLTDEQIELVAAKLSKENWIRSPDWAVNVAYDIAEERAVKMAGRSPAVPRSGEEPRRFMAPVATVP